MYQQGITIVVTPTSEGYMKYIHKLYGKELYKESDFEGDLACSDVVRVDGESHRFIWLPELSIETLPVAIHELQHASYEILKDAHVTFDYENQEPFTYHLQYLVTQFLIKYSEDRKKEIKDVGRKHPNIRKRKEKR